MSQSCSNHINTSIDFLKLLLQLADQAVSAENELIDATKAWFEATGLNPCISIASAVSTYLQHNPGIHADADTLLIPDNIDDLAKDQRERLGWYAWQDHSAYLAGEMQTLSLEGFGDDVSLEGHNHDLAGLVIVSDDSLIQFIN